MPERIDADVCVVGAGYAGLTAARRLSQHVEVSGGARSARPRRRPDLDPTAARRHSHRPRWCVARAVPRRDLRARRRGRRLDVQDVCEGRPPPRRRRPHAPLYRVDSQDQPSRGDLDRARAIQVDRLSKKVPIEYPWRATRAAEWDSRTVASYLEHSEIRTQIGRDLFEMAVRGLFTGDLNDVSFLHLLFLVRAHGSLSKLFSIEKGSQENMVNGGAGSIAAAMATELGDAVRLSAPVHTITQHDDQVVVESEALTVTARNVVVSVPPALAANITFDPDLPDDRMTLYRKAVAGPESKTLIVYDEPFWRGRLQRADGGTRLRVRSDAGRVARVRIAGRDRVVHVRSRRRTPRRARPGRPPTRGDRRAHRPARPRAASPVEFVETAWWTEPWTRGCSMAHFPPGILTALRVTAPRAARTGPLGRNGNIHDVARRDRWRRAFRRTRGERDPRPAVGASNVIACSGHATTHRPQARQSSTLGVYAVCRLWAVTRSFPNRPSAAKSASSIRRTSKTSFGQTSTQSCFASRRA